MHKPSNLTMTTLNETSAYPCFKGKLKILSWDETNCITVKEAYTVKDIPIRPTSSIKQEASKWSHLCDVEFANLPDSEVTVLLGCDVPEAHWPLEQIKSDVETAIRHQNASRMCDVWPTESKRKY